MSIEQILQDFNIPDKPDFFATTSYKFKTDLWNFFNKPEFKASNVVELGTSRGYTTTVLSYLFSNVYTINKKQTQEVKDNLYKLENITCLEIDLYAPFAGLEFSDIPETAVYLIDAGHEKQQVISDIRLCKSHSGDKKSFFVFDDYGSYQSVYDAVNVFVDNGTLKIVESIGHTAGWSYGPPTTDVDRILKNSEGVICQLV